MRPLLVFGSINVDLVMKLPRLPAKYESVLGGSFLQTYGGKGANTAIAAARARGGVPGAVRFAGAVGDDAYGPIVRENFRRDGIDEALVRTVAGTPTGTAFVLLDPAGANYLGVASGANACCDAALAEACRPLLAATAMVLLQNEIPPEVGARMLALATEARVPVLMNYAPVAAASIPVTAAMSGLVVNEVEASGLLGVPVETPEQAMEAAEALRSRGPRWVAVTLGAQGAVITEAGGAAHLPAFQVDVVDTTAAGDTFCGSLAVALAEGRPLRDAARMAMAAAALCCTRLGAQPSIPTRGEIDAFLATRPLRP